MFVKANLLRRLRQQVRGRASRWRSSRRCWAATPRSARTSCSTLLLVVMRNATTDSPWPISNNPYAKYNDRGASPTAISTAALAAGPRQHRGADLFPARGRSRIGPNSFIFVDGGVTMYNNPAFQTVPDGTRRPLLAAGAARRGWRDRHRQDADRLGRHRHQPRMPRGPAAGEMNLLFNATTFRRR